MHSPVVCPVVCPVDCPVISPVDCPVRLSGPVSGISVLWCLELPVIGGFSGQSHTVQRVHK